MSRNKNDFILLFKLGHVFPFWILFDKSFFLQNTIKLYYIAIPNLIQIFRALAWGDIPGVSLPYYERINAA